MIFNKYNPQTSSVLTIKSIRIVLNLVKHVNIYKSTSIKINQYLTLINYTKF